MPRLSAVGISGLQAGEDVNFMDKKLCALPGGVPLSIQQHLIGAVGISGRSLEDDHALALFVSEYVATQFR